MKETDPAALPAQTMDRPLATGWLVLGVSALAFAGIFTILLVLARSPGMEAWFPTQDFFRTALVVHVDQSVLIWFRPLPVWSGACLGPMVLWVGWPWARR